MNRWLFKTKTKTNKTLDRYKAKPVAQGFSQTAGIDYSETFSHIIKAKQLELYLLSLCILGGS